MLPPISEEQEYIVNLLSTGCNIQIEAVAGSGKTTTSLYLALRNPEKMFLLFTYNARLKAETRQKTSVLGLKNLEVHSYHAFCVKYFDRNGCTDSGIIRYLNRASPPLGTLFRYDVIIIDEAQDMNPLYYRLVRRVLQSSAASSQIVVMGDQKQSIYAFNKADPRFLTLAPGLFDNELPWKTATLTTSYRVTRPMADFLNHCCRGAPFIRSIKDGSPVRYIQCSVYGSRTMKEVDFYLSLGYNPEDIFVLAPSVKSAKSPVRILANRLTEKKIPIYVPVSDEEILDQDVLKGKIVFSTFHQVKGLERPVVIVFEFCETYFKYYGKGLSIHEIPNTIYVAITRACTHLSLIHDDTSPFFTFVKKENLFNIESSKKFRPDKKIEYFPNGVTRKEVDVSELVKYMPADILERCMEKIKIKKRFEKSYALELPFKAKQDDFYESVSEINTIAILCFFEYKMKGTLSVLSRCCETIPDLTITRLLQLSTQWVSLKTGYDFKNSQIRTFDWLEEDVLQEAMSRLVRNLPKSDGLQFEKKICHPNFDPEIILTGFIDIFNSESCEIWEVRVSTETHQIHFLYAALYMWLMKANGHVVHKTLLYNVLNNETFEVSIEDTFDDAVSELFSFRKNGCTKTSDDDFLKLMKNLIS